MNETEENFVLILNFSVISSEDAPKVVRRLLHNYIKNNLLPSEDDASGFLSKTICEFCVCFPDFFSSTLQNTEV